MRRLDPLFARAGLTSRQYVYRNKQGEKVRIPGVWLEVPLDATGHVVWAGHADAIQLQRAQRKEDLATRAEVRGDTPAMMRYMAQARQLLDGPPKTVRLYAFFVTLTVRNVPHIWRDASDTDPGGSVLDAAINRPWRILRETARRRPDSAAGRFLRHIRGGADVTEITHHRATGFHPHKHALILADVPYLAKNALRELWADYTGGAGQIVDVRPFYRAQDLQTGEALNAEKAIVELCKYLVKPQSEMDPSALREVVLATRGRRRINTWGCLRELPPAQPEEALNPPDAPAVIPEGHHALYRYTPNGRRYRPLWRWPATVEDPIVPIGRRPDPAPYSTRDDVTWAPAEQERYRAAAIAGTRIPYGLVEDRRVELWERVQRRVKLLTSGLGQEVLSGN
ncbi:MAG: protein rep [Clostridia bacterium]